MRSRIDQILVSIEIASKSEDIALKDFAKTFKLPMNDGPNQQFEASAKELNDFSDLTFSRNDNWLAILNILPFGSGKCRVGSLEN